MVWLVLVVAVAASAPAPRARAEERRPQQRDEREVQARELFGFGKWAEALAIYGKLYAETAHPTYLRNIGRCYQNMGEPDKAIGAFREYLRQVKSLSADQRAVVEGYIREMEQLKEKRQTHGAEAPAPASRAAAAPEKPPTAPAPASGASSVAPAGAVGVSTSATPTDEEGGHGSRRIAAYAVGGAGLVALAVGGFFGFRAISNQHDGETLCKMDPCSRPAIDAYNRAATSARIADFTVGAGLVGAGVAAYLFFSSRGDETKPASAAASRLHLLPELGPAHAGLTARVVW